MQLRKYEQIIYDKRCDNMLLFALNIRGGSRISEGGGGGRLYKGVWVRFNDFI